MQVNLNVQSQAGVQGEGTSFARRVQSEAADRATFQQTAAVENALKSHPEERAEVVARAEKAIGSPQYPPLDGIRRISRLLAANWPTADDKE